MFTGLVQDLGRVVGVNSLEGGLELVIESQLPAKTFAQGASISVNGVCLTVEAYREDECVFQVHAVPETLELTNLSKLSAGDRVNLEASLTLQDVLGGHLVSGHVDGTAEVLEVGTDFRVKLPSEFMKYCPKKGSIALNGVSLTIADSSDEGLRIALIPETLKVTNLGLLKVGERINFEVDPLARYLEQLNKYS